VEYSIYFLFSASVAVVAILAGGGLFVGFNKLGGPLAGDRKKYASLVASLLRLRLCVVGVVVPLLLAVTAVILNKQGVKGSNLVLVLATFAVISGLSLMSGIWTSALLLAGDHEKVQIIGLGVELLRATGMITCALFLPSYEALLGVTLLTGLLSLLFIKQRAISQGLDGGVTEKKYEREMLSDFLRLLPNNFFYAVQGKISTYMLAWFGGGQAVASLGAISRLGRALDPVTVYANNVVQPKCARTTEYVRLRKLIGRIGLATLALAILIAITGVAGGKIFTFILGTNYSGLEQEISIYFTFLALIFISGMLTTINFAKGWIRFVSVGNIPLTILAMVCGAIVFGVDSVNGVLLMGIFSRLPVIGLQLFDLRNGLGKLRDLVVPKSCS